jgi:hypothetical protein
MRVRHVVVAISVQALLTQPTAYGRAPAHCTKNGEIRALLTDAARGRLPADLDRGQ